MTNLAQRLILTFMMVCTFCVWFPAQTKAGEPFTIIFASDPQLPWWRGAHDPNCNSEECVEQRARETNQDQATAINDILHAKWASGGTIGKWPNVPELTIGAGSTIQDPIGVVMNGDLTAFFHGWQVDMYREYYDPGYSNADPAVMTRTIFPGLGNHDYANNVNDCFNNGCAKDAVQYIKDMIEDDTVENFGKKFFKDWDPGSLSYSFEIGEYHFVQLHNRPNYVAPSIDIETSFTWLEKELNDATQRGLRSVVNMHDYGDKMSWDNADFLKAIDGQDVVAVFAGHIHHDHGKVGVVPGTSIPIFRSGASEYNTFLLAEFGDNYMNVGVIDSQYWLGQEKISGASTQNGPALAFHQNDGKLYAAWNGYSDDGIYFASFDNVNWSGQGKIPGVSTQQSPALADYDGSLYAAWNGYHDDGIFYSSYANGAWSGQGKIPGVATKDAPALANHGGKLYAAWNGYSSDGIFFASFGNGAWSGQGKIPGVATNDGPALASYDGKLYAAWNGYSNDGIFFASFENGAWSGQSTIPGVSTKDQPALAAFDDKLYAIWNGYNDDGIYYASFDGTSWSSQQRVGRVSTTNGPALAVYDDDTLFTLWDGYNNDGIFYTSFGGGVKFFEPATNPVLLKTYNF